MTLSMDWLSASYAVIDFHKRAIVFQVPSQAKFEFLCGSRILKPIVVRVRSVSRALITLVAKEGQILVISYFYDVFSEEYGLPLERSVELSIDLIFTETLVPKIPYRMS